jgi:hypothetical protein
VSQTVLQGVYCMPNSLKLPYEDDQLKMISQKFNAIIIIFSFFIFFLNNIKEQVSPY